MLLAASLAATAAPDAAAAGGDDLETLLSEGIVSGASKANEAVSDAPATVVTITSEDLTRFGMRSLAEAINFLGMGLVTQDPLHSAEIGGRGVLITADYDDHILLVVDGHSVNDAFDGTGYVDMGLGLPLELIDHIELILGPGAVLYGDHAMLGVINIVTKRARNDSGVHLVAEGGLSPQQSGGGFTSFAPGDLGTTYRLGAGVGQVFDLLGEPAELTAHVEYYKQAGPPFRWGPQLVQDADGSPANFGPRTPPGVWGGVTRNQYATEVSAGYARLAFGDFALAIRAEAYRRSTPYENSANQPLSNFDDASNRELDRYLSADLQYHKTLWNHLAVFGRLYGDSYDYQQSLNLDDPSFCLIPVTGACQTSFLAAARWAGLELQGSYDWLADGKLTTMLGEDTRVRFAGQTYNVNDGATGSPAGSVGAGSRTDVTYGIYLQQRWSPLKWLHLNAGARFDSDPRGGEHLSPRAATVLDVWKGGTLKALYSEAFRSPSYYEIYYASPAQAEQPPLKAETERGVEATFEQRFAANRVMFGVFRTWWFDMVQAQQDAISANGIYYGNVSSIDNYGYNAAVEGRAGALSYGGSLTGAYTRRSTATGLAPLTVAPQIFGNARIAYDLPGALPVVAATVSLVGPRLADRALDGSFPRLPVAPAALGLRVTASGDVSGVEGLSYRVSWDYSTGSVVPYVAGPNQYEDPTVPNRPAAELVPVNRMTAFATLRYTFSLGEP